MIDRKAIQEQLDDLHILNLHDALRNQTSAILLSFGAGKDTPRADQYKEDVSDAIEVSRMILDEIERRQKDLP